MLRSIGFVAIISLAAVPAGAAAPQDPSGLPLDAVSQTPASGTTLERISAGVPSRLVALADRFDALTIGPAPQIAVRPPSFYPRHSAWPVVAGDLDGDALEDLFVFEQAENAVRIVGRSGRTGTELYRIEQTPFKVRPAVTPSIPRFGTPPSGVQFATSWTLHRDVTGDGRRDLTLLAVDSIGSGDRVGTERTGFRVQTFDGTTGDQLWERTWIGERRYGPGIDRYEDLPITIDTVGGTGADAMLLLATARGTQIERGERGRRTGAVTVQLLHAATGEVRSEFDRPLTRTLPAPAEGGDLDQDGALDLLEVRLDRDRTNVTALRLDGSEIWTATAPAAEYLLARSAALVSSRSDVLLRGLSISDAGDWSFLTQALRGVDGQLLWSEADWPSIGPDLDGDGGGDIVEVTGDNRTVHVRSGATLGTITLRSYPAVVPAENDTFVWFPGDLDGDGRGDLFLEGSAYGEDGHLYGSTTAIANDGLEALWAESHVDGSEYPLPLRLAYDADPGIDLYRSSPDGSSLQIVDGATFETLTSLPVADPVDTRMETADLDPRPGTEMLVWDLARDTTIRAVDRDGHTLWALSS